MSNELTCATCKYSDIECNEQCKEISAENEQRLKAQIERCRGCMGATFLDCTRCETTGSEE